MPKKNRSNSPLARALTDSLGTGAGPEAQELPDTQGLTIAEAEAEIKKLFDQLDRPQQHMLLHRLKSKYL